MTTTVVRITHEALDAALRGDAAGAVDLLADLAGTIPDDDLEAVARLLAQAAVAAVYRTRGRVLDADEMWVLTVAPGAAERAPELLWAYRYLTAAGNRDTGTTDALWAAVAGRGRDRTIRALCDLAGAAARVTLDTRLGTRGSALTIR